MKEITDIKEKQKIGLDMLLYVDKLCKDNNIKYMLGFGTALGAVRHKGFIPWDDDIDLFMLYDDYIKFIKIASSNNDRYICLCFENGSEGYYHPIAKIIDTKTAIEKPLHKIPNDGMWLDIWPIVNLPKNCKHVCKKFCFYQKCARLASAKKWYKKSNIFSKFASRLAFWYCKMMGYKHFLKKCNKIYLKYRNKDTGYAGVYSLIAKEKNQMPVSLYSDIIYVDFENHKLPIMKNYDYYLTKIYGDYMTPPPEDERETHSFYKLYWRD